MKKYLQVLNGVAFIGTVFINYLSNTGALNNSTIGDVSQGINSLFTPAGYAFSIWGLIYMLLFCFIIYQGRSLFIKVKNDDFIEKIGIWFVISCLANSAWVFAWIYEYTGLSCIFIFLLLFSLLKIVDNNKMQIVKVSKATQFFIWLPFAIYSGWVTVASVANVSSFLVKINWNGFGFSSEFWVTLMIIIATLINILILWKRKIKAFVFVAIWALVAIGVANQNRTNNIDDVAYISAAILLVSIISLMLKNRKISNQ